MKLQTLDLKQITINDAFWSKHVDLVRNEIIPYQWDAMNDRIPGAEPSHCLENFKIAAGRKTGEFYGAVFQDTDIAKWLEAVGFTLAAYDIPELEQTADEVVELIGEAQEADGYLDTYFIIKEPDKRWQNLCEGHELYTAGHMIEAAVAYYQGTGKRRFLDIVLKLADLICDTFGSKPGQLKGYPGHQEIEIGLIKLYHITGEKKYLDQAKFFIDMRGVGENWFLKEMKRPGHHMIFPEFADYDTKYSQSHLPVRQQKTAEGHAVRAVYMYCAMADLAYEYQDNGLMQACETLWRNIVTRRMYLTGSIGSSGLLERFTTDYDLPNDCNYSESCASIGLALFGLRMANITRDASYIDVVERALYNTVLAGIALDGKSFFYVNPLEVWPDNCIPRTSKEHVKPVRQKWFGVACCPPNIARTLASLGQYIYAQDDHSLYINLYVSGEAKARIGGKEIQVSMETRYPWINSCKVTLRNVPAEGMTLAMRIPEYAENYQVEINGRACGYRAEKGYAYVNISNDCTVGIRFEAPARFIRANPKVRADCGRVAIVRGPLVYCLEQIDNGENLSAVYVKADSVISEEESELFGGSVRLRFDGYRMDESRWDDHELYASHKMTLHKAPLKAIPYAYWNNRGTGEMSVWIKELPAGGADAES